VTQGAKAISPEAPLGLSVLSRSDKPRYGVGVTVGAGVYVLIGAAAAHSGMYAPTAFAIAALLMALTAASFAELVTRAPVAAGEAAYVALAFHSDRFGARPRDQRVTWVDEQNEQRLVCDRRRAINYGAQGGKLPLLRLGYAGQEAKHRRNEQGVGHRL
jgi:amino acid transporter